MLATALAVADRLSERTGLSVRVLSFHTVKPIDIDAVRKCADETKCVVTFEEHGPAGGLGDSIARELARGNRFGTPLKVFAAKEGFEKITGTQRYLRERGGLDPQTILTVLEPWVKENLQA